jgi:hypothetical protein
MRSTAFPYLSDLVKALTGFTLPLPLPTFGLMVALALVVSIWVAGRELRRLHETGRIGPARRRIKGKHGQRVEVFVPPQEIVGDLGVIGVVAGLVGARLFHLLENPHEFMADPWGMIFSRSGFTIFGGLIFGTIAGVIYVKQRGLPVRVVSDGVAPAMMLGYAIGRIGCQLSGDGDWGIPATSRSSPAGCLRGSGRRPTTTTFLASRSHCRAFIQRRSTRPSWGSSSSAFFGRCASTRSRRAGSSRSIFCCAEQNGSRSNAFA